MIYQFLIINSSGSMIYTYQKYFKFSTNQLLILSGTLHSVNCMIDKLNKEDVSVKYFNYKNKVISYFRSATNLSFIFVSDKKETSLYKLIFQEFCDYVLLDPFYILDMPINSPKFQPSKHFT
ncbi:trafficking protein particle complex subunit [Vairimorpha necatrix]|uniref:Trafficking protein particle complex subunit n=1 Tax=Vairimorpha necatrix TaxID=6039 RepID=A0AAX4J8J8_9MICR